ncbi:4 5-DOPA dioxygenase extradiol 1 [Bienertia sinuspersici]
MVQAIKDNARSSTRPLDETPHFHGGVAPWAAEFDSWLQNALVTGSYMVSSFVEISKSNSMKKLIDVDLEAMPGCILMMEEDVIGKCNVVCTLKDSQNKLPSGSVLGKANYFSHTFNVKDL